MDKPRFVSLPKGTSLFTVTLGEALTLFNDSQPKALMTIDGKEVITGEGKYGVYIKYDGQFFSVPKGVVPSSMTEDDVRALIEKHRRQAEPLHRWGDIQVLQGRYGAYIKTPQGNFRIPKNTVVETLTEDECKRIIDAAAAAPAKK